MCSGGAGRWNAAGADGVRGAARAHTRPDGDRPRLRRCCADRDAYGLPRLRRHRFCIARTQPKVEAGQEELIALLDDIEANLPIGVAGSSLKAVPFALKLIDWAQNTPLDDDGVKGAVLSWLLNKGNDKQAAFSEQFALAYSAYRTLTSGNETEAADLLDSAGCTDRDASPLPAESLPRAETLKNIIGE